MYSPSLGVYDTCAGNALETEYPKNQDMVLMSYISGSISGDDVKKM